MQSSITTHPTHCSLKQQFISQYMSSLRSTSLINVQQTGFVHSSVVRAKSDTKTELIN
jgi:hypothetical protein